MADIGVFNPVFRRGGSDAVMMNIIEALQEIHNLSIFSFNDPDFSSLNSYFDTDVSGVNVADTGKLLELVPYSMDLIKRFTGKWMGSLHVALATKKIRSLLSDFDLVISSGELPLRCAKIQYIHYPRFYSHQISSSTVDNIYQKICKLVGRYDKDTIRGEGLVANSNWTKNIIDTIYSSNSQVVYPPVNVRQFGAKEWENQENGIVCIGRIDKTKKIHSNILVVDQLVKRGHELHLHIIGPTTDSGYCDQIEEMASTRSYVYLEGAVPRDEMVKMVDSHKYGIHGKENEHFGIAVAEMVAAKTIPLVPDGGGQAEIVKGIDELKYTDRQEAIDKLERIVSDKKLQQRVLQILSDVEQRFGKERFHSSIREIVSVGLEK